MVIVEESGWRAYMSSSRQFYTIGNLKLFQNEKTKTKTKPMGIQQTTSWRTKSSWIWASGLDEVGHFEYCICVNLCWEAWQLCGGVIHFARTFLGCYLSGPLPVLCPPSLSSSEKEIWDKHKVTCWQFLEIGLLLLGQWGCPVDKDSLKTLSVVQPLISLWICHHSFTCWAFPLDH